jgi:hypothetical protein
MDLRVHQHDVDAETPSELGQPHDSSHGAGVHLCCPIRVGLGGRHSPPRFLVQLFVDERCGWNPPGPCSLFTLARHQALGVDVRTGSSRCKLRGCAGRITPPEPLFNRLIQSSSTAEVLCCACLTHGIAGLAGAERWTLGAGRWALGRERWPASPGASPPDLPPQHTRALPEPYMRGTCGVHAQYMRSAGSTCMHLYRHSTPYSTPMPLKEPRMKCLDGVRCIPALVHVDCLTSYLLPTYSTS